VYPIEFFWRAVRRFPTRPAILGAGGPVTFAELGRQVERRAAMIQDLVPDRSAMVGVGADNGIDHLVAILGVLAAGKIWVPLNPRNGDPELRRQMDFIQPRLVLADGDMARRLASAACPIEDIGTAPPPSTVALDMGPDARTAFPLDTTQAVKFTGGSTGAPKAVMQPLRAWTANILTQMQAMGLGPDDRYLVAAPLTHGTSTYMLPVLAGGGALIFPRSSKPAGLLDAAAEHGATLFFAPPTLILSLVDEQRRVPRELSALRHLVYGGAPMRPEQIRDAQGCFGKIVCTSYGQTEAPQIMTFLAPADMEGDGLLSVGRPSLFTQVAILDADRNPVPSGTEGEIVVRGDLCMTGYLHAAEETARTLVDGWLLTGDIGLLDERGMLFIKDRLRDVIITGGFNVYPGDVEVVIAEDPAVLNCSVVGIPDAKWGEAVHVAIELREGSAFDPASVQARVKAALGSVKTPKGVHVFEALPRNPVGKIVKSDIRAEIVRRLTADMVPA
jgi:fatty-acyl-CoA synthase